MHKSHKSHKVTSGPFVELRSASAAYPEGDFMQKQEVAYCECNNIQVVCIETGCSGGWVDKNNGNALIIPMWLMIGYARNAFE